MSLKDVLGIDFEGATEDALVEAIQSLQSAKDETPKDDSKEVKHLKELISKANSEAADFKKKYMATLSDAEKAKAEREAQQQEIENELATLRRDRDVKDQMATYTAMGFDTELAKETAEALVDGNLAKVNSNLQAFVETVKQKAVADAMRDTPKPGSAGNGEKPLTKDDIMSIRDDTERQLAIAKNRELFM